MKGVPEKNEAFPYPLVMMGAAGGGGAFPLPLPIVSQAATVNSAIAAASARYLFMASRPFALLASERYGPGRARTSAKTTHYLISSPGAPGRASDRADASHARAASRP